MKRKGTEEKDEAARSLPPTIAVIGQGNKDSKKDPAPEVMTRKA
ncbi:MAG: hypothetical protein U5L72_09430 [Bacteroidales bacterium]|nr:hypothetical protein [Bacteroidales bacterium]